MHINEHEKALHWAEHGNFQYSCNFRHFSDKFSVLHTVAEV